MQHSDPELLTPVAPLQLEQAYRVCAHLFEDTKLDGTVNAEAILDEIEKVTENVSKADVIDIFRRLCLTIQLIGDIDANWIESGYPGDRLERIPSALFELAGSETAFEEMDGGYANTYFARPVLDEAFALLRLN